MIKLLKNRKRYRLFTGLIAFLLVCLMVLPGVFIHSGITAQAAEKKDIYYWERLNTLDYNYLDIREFPDSFRDDLTKWYRVLIVYESQYFQNMYGKGQDLSYAGADVSEGNIRFSDHVYSYVTGCDFQYYIDKKHDFYSTLNNLQYWLGQLEDNDYGWNDRVLADDEEESLDDTEFCMVMPAKANSAYVAELDPTDKNFRTIGALGTPFIKYADKESTYHYVNYNANSKNLTGRPKCYYIALANSDDSFSGKYLACDGDGIYAPKYGASAAAEPPSSVPSALGTWAFCCYNNVTYDEDDRRNFFKASFPKSFFGNYGYDNYNAHTFSLCWEKSTGGSDEENKASKEWHSYPVNFAANLLTMEGDSKYNENSKFKIYIGKKDNSISVRSDNLQVASGQVYQIDRPLLLDEKKTITVNKDGILVISATLFLVGNIENRGLIIIDDGGFVSCGPGRKGTGAITCIGGDIVVNKWGMLYASPAFHPPLELRDGSSLINNGCCMIGNMRTQSGSLFRNRKGATFFPRTQIQKGQEFRYLTSPYDSGLTVTLTYPYTLVEPGAHWNPSKGHYIFYSSLTFVPEKVPESKKFYENGSGGNWKTVEKKQVWDLKGSVEELGLTTTSYKELKGYSKQALYEFPEDKCYPPEVTKNSHIGRYCEADYVLSFVPIQ